MTTGNGVPTATDGGEDIGVPTGRSQLRDIEELVAKLRIVTKQLEVPLRSDARAVTRGGTPARPVGRAGEAGEPYGERK